MATLYKEYTVTSGQTVNHTFQFAATQGATQPAWFTWVDTIIPDWVAGYSFVAPGLTGTYEVFFTSYFAPVIEYKIVINVVLSDYTAYENCCGDRNLAWLNIQGGWQNYIFTGIKEFKVEVGKNKQFKTNEYVSKHSQIEGVFDGEVITSGDIPKSHVDALDTLKYAIQVFLYNTDTLAWDIPLLVDVGSFSKYKSNDKFYEVRLKFIYATEILVQTQ